MSKILIVDDEEDFEFLAKQKFRKRVSAGDFQLFFAHNGWEALDVIKADGPMDVVISDINMPEMDGIALISNIKTHHPRTKTIVVSAYGDSEILRSAMNKGAFDFVTKPVIFTDLESTIDRALKDLQETPHLFSTVMDYQLSLSKAWNFKDLDASVALAHTETEYLFDVYSIDESMVTFGGLKASHPTIPHALLIGQLHLLWRMCGGDQLEIAQKNFMALVEKYLPETTVHGLWGIYHTNTRHLWTVGDKEHFILTLLDGTKTNSSSLQKNLLIKTGHVLEIIGSSVPKNTPPPQLSLAFL